MPLLYVHVPFCQSKCAYCAFYSEPLSGESRRSQIRHYLEGIEIEAIRRKQDTPQGVSSLFIGGGTPSVLSAGEMERLFQIINANFFEEPQVGSQLDARLKRGIERTVEANPGTLNAEKLQVLYAQGINRISLGVQSFSDALLKRIGRIHTAQDVDDSILQIRKTGFQNLNLDLMFGLPGQSLELWEASLNQALTYRPEHLSLYALILEEGTALAEQFNSCQNETLLFPDDELQAHMYEFAVKFLKEAGYIHYETSNFALPGYQCWHNLGYWQGQDYLGLGPGAVSCLGGVRWRNHEDIKRYAEQLKKYQEPISEREELTLKEQMTERIMLGLRMQRGLDLNAFSQEFGVEFRDIYGKIMESYLSQGILELDQGFLRINPQFAFVANSVIVEFI